MNTRCGAPACLLMVLTVQHAISYQELPIRNNPTTIAWIDTVRLSRVSVSPDGKWIAVLRKRPEVELSLHDRSTGKLMWKVRDRLLARPQLLLFTPDSKRLLTFGAERTNAKGRLDSIQVLIWDVNTHKCVQWIQTRSKQGVRIVPFAGAQTYAVSNQHLIVCGRESKTSIYDLATGKECGTLPTNKGMNGIAVSADGKWLISHNTDSSLSVWDVEKCNCCCTLDDSINVDAVAISSRGDYCAVLTTESDIFVYDRATGKKRSSIRINKHLTAHFGLLFSPDDKTLIVNGWGLRSGLLLWDWQTNHAPRPLSGSGQAVRRIVEMSAASDGSLLTWGSNQALMWNLGPTTSQVPKTKK